MKTKAGSPLLFYIKILITPQYNYTKIFYTMCKGAQNRIEYIVLQQPLEASKIVEKYGYEAPRKVEELVKVVKLLIKKKGEPMIKELINIHPEKKLILEMSGHTSDESNFCGCHSSYTGEVKDLLDHLADLSSKDLTELYDDIKKKSKEAPDDKTLIAQAEMIWDEMQRRKKQTEKQDKQIQEDKVKFYLQLGLCFLGGFVFAKLISNGKNYQ
jgi:hypothetical protein